MWGCPVFFPFRGGGFGLTGILVCVLVFGAIFLIIRSVWPPRDRDHRRGAQADREDAMRILRTRLAEGAISEEEFERLRRAVES